MIDRPSIVRARSPGRSSPAPEARATPRAGAAAPQVVVARAPKHRGVQVGGVELTHPDRAIWPGVTKRDLALYWQEVAGAALRGLAFRPLSILRCPDGIGGKQQFFQKSGHGLLPGPIREGLVAKAPYLAIDDVDGLIAMAQVSAIELHPWGASEDQPLHPGTG